MSIINLVGKAFPVGVILKTLIGYISDLLEQVAPDELTEEQQKQVQNWVGTIYAALKNFGPELVESTETDLDDAVLSEMIEICELAADKYGLVLNPEEL